MFAASPDRYLVPADGGDPLHDADGVATVLQDGSLLDVDLERGVDLLGSMLWATAVPDPLELLDRGEERVRVAWLVAVLVAETPPFRSENCVI